ncbi:MAG: hypothetical protein PHO57_09035 [Acidithiobacillus sp.]|nr:hypothetical protein [Acidithiobacillus sp.]
MIISKAQDLSLLLESVAELPDLPARGQNTDLKAVAITQIAILAVWIGLGRLNCAGSQLVHGRFSCLPRRLLLRRACMIAHEKA